LSPKRGQRGPVGRLQRRTVDLASQNRHLVAQDYDLNREIVVRAARESDQLEDANQRPVQEREGPSPDARQSRTLPSRSSSQLMDGILGTHKCAVLCSLALYECPRPPDR
jgi:hypothetical protein